MTKLTDTQAMILSAASQREGAIALPLPPGLRGGAAKKVVGALLAKGCLAEVPAGRAPGTLVWQETDEGFTTLVATAEGLAAIGIEPDSAAEAGTEAPEGGDAPKDADSRGTGATEADTGSEGGRSRNRQRPKIRAGTKQAALIAMLRSADGATVAEIAAATGWQPHTVRGAIAGALKKRLGLAVTSGRVERRGRVYRIAD